MGHPLLRSFQPLGEGARATTPLSGDSGGLGTRQALMDGFSDSANSALLIYAVAINYPR